MTNHERTAGIELPTARRKGGAARGSKSTAGWWQRALAEARRVSTATPLGLAVLLVGLFVAIGALGASALSNTITGLVTRQIVETLGAEAAGLQELDRVGGPAAVRAAIEARITGEPRVGAGRHLYLLVDGSGQRIAGTLATDSEALMRAAAGGMFRAATNEPHGARWSVGVPVPLAFGARAVVVRDVEDVRDLAERMRWMLITALGSIAAVGVGLGVASSRQVLARIETVTRTSDQIMAGDLTRRIPVAGTGDEVDDLSRRLNSMLDRIEHLLAGMREISDNIAHDLKTPLNRLRNRAEAALRDPAGAAAHRDGLERTIEAADDIITTFNALLLIARLEAGAVRESFTTFDLAELVRDLSELYAPVVEESRAAFVVDVPDSLQLTGNRQLIGQAVANLIDNAIKYGAVKSAQSTAVGPSQMPAGITIRLRREADAAVLTIADRGPGIPAEDRDKVLRRFVRLDQSRTAPGTGLGLSLVAAVARLHNARLTLGDAAPGLAVELAVPLAPGSGSPAVVSDGT